jgi:hypothetical protein
VHRRPGTPLSCAMQDRFYVYILASRFRGTMYVGLTNDLSRRMAEHKSGHVPGFSRAYKVIRLVYAEPYASILDAPRPRACAQALAPALEIRADRKGPSYVSKYPVFIPAVQPKPNSHLPLRSVKNTWHRHPQAACEHLTLLEIHNRCPESRKTNGQTCGNCSSRFPLQ